ncbi:MAG: sortase [Candidatus Roizmanbacteria bacterium]|nr:sortase [Candidatus Roizmanbacteria bacterium]
MKTSGVIYQYIDKPALPDALILEASTSFSTSQDTHREESSADFDVQATVLDPMVTHAFAVPENDPVKIITQKNREISFSIPDTFTSFLRQHLSNAFRVMIGFAMIGAVFLVTPLVYTELQFQLNPPEPKEEINLSQIEIVDSVVDTPTFTKLLNDKYIKKLEPVNTDYALVIPKIGVNSAVVANVDPGNKEEYVSALKQGAAHAKGTALPNEYGSKYIFAHSTDYIWNVTNYNAIFYLLKDLELNDQIYIVYNGTIYPYKVSETRVVNADDTYYLKPNNLDNRLILQTCWPPGTTWKRMLVFAEPIDTSLDNEDVLSYSLDNSQTN